jgi:hypothetical protein
MANTFQTYSTTASQTYNLVPTLCKTALKQGAFILAMHCIATGISEYRSDGKDGEKAEELTIEQKILAGVFTSIFSGTFRAICSQLTEKKQIRDPSSSIQAVRSDQPVRSQLGDSATIQTV